MPIQDFIPAGSEMTEETKAALQRQRLYGQIQDFVPAADTPEDASRQEKFDKAKVAAKLRSKRNRSDKIEVAQDRLGRMSVADTVDYIEALPQEARYLWLEAERNGRARVQVLRQFKGRDGGSLDGLFEKKKATAVGVLEPELGPKLEDD